jgi:hypothetical protein
LSVAPQNGFTGTVTFTCTGLPAGTTWSVSPNPLTMNGATASYVTVSVNTSGGSGGEAKSVAPQLVPKSIFLALLPFSMVGILLIKKNTRRGIWLVLGLLVLCLLFGMAGCGSGGGSSSSGVAPGAYQFTLTGTASGGTETLKVPLQLVVNQQ